MGEGFAAREASARSWHRPVPPSRQGRGKDFSAGASRTYQLHSELVVTLPP